MDVLQDYVPMVYNLYTNYYTPYEPYIRPLRRYLFLAQSYAFTYLYPILYPAYRLISGILSRTIFAAQPDIVLVGLLILVLVLSLKLLDLLRRHIIYWISMMLRLAMYAGVAALGLYVYNRGVEQSLEDLGWLAGFLMETGEEGESIGTRKGRDRMADARRAGAGAAAGPRGRTRGAGW